MYSGCLWMLLVVVVVVVLLGDVWLCIWLCALHLIIQLAGVFVALPSPLYSGGPRCLT
jgi:hypothetical protein